VACRPPYALESEITKLPSRKKPGKIDSSMTNKVAGLDSMSLFYVSQPRGVKPIRRPGSNIFGSPEIVNVSDMNLQKRMYWTTSSSTFAGRSGETPQACTTWLWHPYHRPLYMAPYAPDKPGPPEMEAAKPDKPVAGLNSAELSAVQDIPMPRGVKRIPLPDSNIFGVAEDEPFHTGQEVGFRFPSMVQVSMLERQLKPHVPKDAEVGMYHSHSAPDLRGCCHKCHRSLTSQRGGLRSTKAH
jgi:hypothetical protein